MPSLEIEDFIARVPGAGPALPLSDCGPAGAAMPGNWFAIPAPRRGSKILAQGKAAEATVLGTRRIIA
jgi:hypothetical protein